MEKTLNNHEKLQKALDRLDTAKHMRRIMDSMNTDKYWNTTSDLFNKESYLQNTIESLNTSRFLDESFNLVNKEDFIQKTLDSMNADKYWNTTFDLFNKESYLQNVLENLNTDKYWNDTFDWLNNLYHSIQDLSKIDDLKETATNILENYSSTDLKIGNDGTISVLGEMVSIDEINNEVQSFLKANIYLPSQNKIRDFLNNLIAKIRQLKKPIQFVLIHIILQLFLNVMSVYVYHLVETKLNPPKFSKREIIKKIRGVTQQKFDLEQLKNHRIVSANILNVRDKPDHQSRKIDKLSLGQVVKVIEKKRNWTLIEYHYENSDDIFNGWVFTRYLEKIHK